LNYQFFGQQVAITLQVELALQYFKKAELLSASIA
jgi:hypothetical protein